MKSKLLSGCLVFLALTSAVAFGAVSKATKDVTPKKRPDLKIDRTPVTDGKSPVVASYADVLDPVQKAVVSIYSTKIVRERFSVNPFFRQFGIPDQERESKQEGMGSGVVVSADGYILTNNHVVEGADELKVSLADDREFTAKVIGADPKTDVAVIKIDAEKLPTVTLADSDKLRVGDVVFAVGNPLNVGQTVTMGIVSAKGRNKVHLLDEVGGYENFIQTDAAINMGNSGGALVDAKGRLVGINSAIISTSRGSIGIGFAIPINLAASVMNSLVETGSVARGYLGVRPEQNPVTPDVAEQLGLPKDTKGVVVTDVDPETPAEKAGIKRNDVLLSINGELIASAEELRLRIAQLAPGTVVKIKLARDGKEKTVDVTLGKLAENPNELIPGVTVVALTDEARRRLAVPRRLNGLLVTEVDPKTAIAELLTPDTLIIEINRQPATDLPSARSLMRSGPNLLLVLRRGQLGYMTIRID